MLRLDDDICYLKGIGEKRAKLLKEELKLFTVEDLLYYFPYKYVDKTKIYRISDIHSSLSSSIQLKGRLGHFSEVGMGRGKRLTASFSDYTGQIELVWFKGINWVKKTLKPGAEYLLYGKPTLFNHRFNISHPELELLGENTEKETGIQPVYAIPDKLKKQFITSKQIQIAIKDCFAKGFDFQESFPQSVLEKQSLVSGFEALKQLHQPDTEEQRLASEYRIKFEELFYIQLKLLLQKSTRKARYRGHIFAKIGQYFNQYYKEQLSFELTNAQKRVIKEIRSDVNTGRQMNRLVQGDVGSGKTLVALFAMLMAVDNQSQAAMMAPTEVLAQQHYESLKEGLEKIGIKPYLLTGSTKTKERKEIHQGLLDGSISILIGTHALIEDTVQFNNLGLVVIDEQHRFGVAQRASFWKKNSIPPHILIMTATPIPRTLSMTLYGDLDVSIIDELPPGRKPIVTTHLYDNQQPRINKFMREQIAKGRQVYVVYPLIKESEKLDYKALEEGFWTLSEDFPVPDYAISIVHGQAKAADKEIEMQRFIKQQTQILVATTVIEVGVNVPNATVMIIESAERFGLSQLHQLRGRVGRGAEQSYCILKTSHKLSKDSRTRIEAMVNSNDGFKLAEIDLKLRGPGSIEGTQQSGVPLEFKKANLLSDQNILTQAREVVEQILEKDPELKLSEHSALKATLKQRYSSKINWSRIG